MDEQKKKLMDSFGLKDEMLQKKCSKNHIVEISTFIAWDKVGPRLKEINRDDITGIDKDGHDEGDKRSKLLYLWVERNGEDATYDQMITAMLGAKNKSNAEAVCKLLNPNHNTGWAWPSLPPLSSMRLSLPRRQRCVPQGPRLLVIAGAPGSRVAALVERLCKKFKDKVKVCPTHTTRRPKTGETQGAEFYFTTMEEMKQGIESGDFLEKVDYTDAMYGTRKTTVTKIQSDNKICILVMDDIERVRAAKNQEDFGTFLVLIRPPELAGADDREMFDHEVSEKSEDNAFDNLTKAITGEKDFSTILAPPTRAADPYHVYQVVKNYAIVIVLATLLGLYSFPLEF